MTSNDDRRPHAEMLDIALALMDLFAPFCHRIAIGGSIRRGEPTCKDVELICIPTERNLPVRKKNRLTHFVLPQNGINWCCDELLRSGEFKRRYKSDGSKLAWADRFHAINWRGVSVDLFSVIPPATWGVIYLIRTGPDRANRMLVTPTGSLTADYRDRGILPRQFGFEKGQLWMANQEDSAKLGDLTRITTDTEMQVYNALNLPYLPPNKRSAERYDLFANRRYLRDFLMEDLPPSPVPYIDYIGQRAPCGFDLYTPNGGHYNTLTRPAGIVQSDVYYQSVTTTKGVAQ